ncbi:hypothetical protein D3C78_916470 [compost metagenome]
MKCNIANFVFGYGQPCLLLNYCRTDNTRLKSKRISGLDRFQHRVCQTHAKTYPIQRGFKMQAQSPYKLGIVVDTQLQLDLNFIDHGAGIHVIFLVHPIIGLPQDFFHFRKQFCPQQMHRQVSNLCFRNRNSGRFHRRRDFPRSGSFI